MAVDRPLIGCTTYRKQIQQKNPIEVYGLMPSYTEAISAAGGVPVLIPLGLSEAALETIIDRMDGLFLPGGGDVDPTVYGGDTHAKMWGIDGERDRTEFLVTRAAVTLQKPVLAVCRGIQVFNVALGGTLWEDLASRPANGVRHDLADLFPRNHLAHTVSLTPNSLVARLLGRTETGVNSLHHQAIRDLAPGLTVTGTAPDGLVEAVEIPGHPYAVGVQWHPENLIADDPAMLGLFRGLVEAAIGRSVPQP